MSDFSLGSLVRERRGEQSLRSLSACLGISAATLSRVERGRTIDVATYRRLMGWLGIPAEAGHLLEHLTALEARVAQLEKRLKELEAKEERNYLGKVLSWGVK